MTQGFIYILTNEAMPGIVKVGKTKNEPIKRASQLSSATGVPLRFSAFRHYEVLNSDEAEKFAHRILERIFGRPNSQREFFSGSPEDISEILDDALVPFLVREDSFLESRDLLGPILRLERKEFTFAKLEFEELFRLLSITEDKIAVSPSLQRAVGAYLASCFALNKAPAYRCVLGVRIKSTVMAIAIGFAKEFDDEAVSSLISFVRRIG